MILYIKNRFFCNKYGEYSGIVDKTLQMSYNAKVVYVRLHRILRAFLSNNISARADGLPPLRLSCQNNANVCANCATKPRNDRINQFIDRIVHCAFYAKYSTILYEDLRGAKCARKSKHNTGWRYVWISRENDDVIDAAATSVFFLPRNTIY